MYTRPESDKGYRCLEVRLKDATGGLVFQAEPASPMEASTTVCWITDIQALIAPGPISPRRLPLASVLASPAPAAARILSMSLLANSQIQGLLVSLGAPLGVIQLQFRNVVASGAGGTVL